MYAPYVENEYEFFISELLNGGATGTALAYCSPERQLQLKLATTWPRILYGLTR